MSQNIFDCSSADPEVTVLIRLLEHAKVRTFDVVGFLSVKDLDFTLTKGTPTIGALLRHMICVEEIIRVGNIESRMLSKEEELFWSDSIPGPGKLLDRSISGFNVRHYQDLWKEIRQRTIAALKDQSKEWLYQTSGGEHTNFFTWFHVIEDQLCHLGQIKYIMKRIPPTT